MTETTSRFALPLLAAGQAQKELFHNEALAVLDALLLAAVAPPQDTLPDSPAEASGWIVGGSPTGAWIGRANSLAIRMGGGWRFLAPPVGTPLQLADGRPARWDGTVWNLGQVLGDAVVIGGVPVVVAQQPAIADPSGGTRIDAECRSAVGAILAALRDHGLIAT